MPKGDDAIMRRILLEIGIPDLMERLQLLQGNDFRNVLTHAVAEHVRRRSVQDVRKAGERTEFFGPSDIDQRELHRFDGLFYRVLPETFAAVELSPVNPLGLNAILTRVSQNNVLSGIRGMEVVADPTTALSLEASRRRKKFCAKNPREFSIVDLCTKERVLRLQPFDKSLGYMQHFDLFALCTAGQNAGGSEAFTIEHALRHLRIHLDLVRVLNLEGFDIRNVTVCASDIRVMEQLVQRAQVDRAALMYAALEPTFKPFDALKVNLPAETTSLEDTRFEEYGLDVQAKFLSTVGRDILVPLQREYPEIQIGFDLARMAGLGYYSDFCFHIYATNKDNRKIQLSDGGISDWTQRLLDNRNEYLLTSGFGAELVHHCFRR